MKNVLLVILVGIGLAIGSACSTKTTSVKVDLSDVSYYKDTRTGLCFAAIGSHAGGQISDNGTGMGFACVPCDSLKNVKVIKN